MYFKTILSVLFFSIFLMACGEKTDNSKSGSDDPKETMETKAGEPVDANSTSERGAGEMAPLNGETSIKKVGGNDNILSNTTVSPSTPPGINPPHGQPGHDCKIPVGQPLDGSTVNSGASNTPKINMNNNSAGAGPRINAVPQNAVPKTTGTVTQTAPGMNPPHGQPGHDCAIPVGAPLNGSK